MTRLWKLSFAFAFLAAGAIGQDTCWRTYPKCRPGFTGVGFVCWEDCPSGFRDDGAFCAKPAAYGRGAGYGYVPIFEGRADAQRRCEADHGAGNCERSLEMFYPKCRPGFAPVGCCICSPMKTTARCCGSSLRSRRSSDG